MGRVVGGGKRGGGGGSGDTGVVDLGGQELKEKGNTMAIYISHKAVGVRARRREHVGASKADQKGKARTWANSGPATED